MTFLWVEENSKLLSMVCQISLKTQRGPSTYRAQAQQDFRSLDLSHTGFLLFPLPEMLSPQISGLDSAVSSASLSLATVTEISALPHPRHLRASFSTLFFPPEELISDTVHILFTWLIVFLFHQDLSFMTVGMGVSCPLSDPQRLGQNQAHSGQAVKMSWVRTEWMWPLPASPALHLIRLLPLPLALIFSVFLLPLSSLHTLPHPQCLFPCCFLCFGGLILTGSPGPSSQHGTNYIAFCLAFPLKTR